MPGRTPPPVQTDGARLAETRERFLTAESVDPHLVRDTILSSWWRSRRWKVAADHIDPQMQRDPRRHAIVWRHQSGVKTVWAMWRTPPFIWMGSSPVFM